MELRGHWEYVAVVERKEVWVRSGLLVEIEPAVERIVWSMDQALTVAEAWEVAHTAGAIGLEETRAALS